MKTVYNYLVESTFGGPEFYKHAYAKDVIHKIISTGVFRLGARGEKTYTVPDDIRPALNKELGDIEEAPSKEAFDEILKKYSLPKWTDIFKGDFSGYAAGLASKNRGNAFEDEFIVNFQNKYAKELQDALKLKEGTFEGCEPTAMGAENQPRPITKHGKYIVLGGSHATVGESVVDVFVKDVDGNPYNLSLKYGATVTFCNAGIKRIFTPRSFDSFKVTGKYQPETFNGVDGNDILTLLGIDPIHFAQSFTSKEKIDAEDVTKQLKGNDQLMKFLESVIGYNFVLVHKKSNGKVEYIDLRKENDMHRFIGNVRSAKVYYKGLTGTGTRVDVVVELDNLIIKFNIRDKQANMDHYPTHLDADYTIK